MALSFNPPPGPGRTRDCTDPWKFAILRSNGDVSLCCRSQVLGNTRERPMAEILEGEAAQRMRVALLTGRLPPDCIQCSERGVTSLEALRERVQHVLYEEPLAETEDLRRQLRQHKQQSSELLREREHLRAHAANLESERAALTEHLASLAQEHQRLRELWESKRSLWRRLRSRLGLGSRRAQT